MRAMSPPVRGVALTRTLAESGVPAPEPVPPARRAWRWPLVPRALTRLRPRACCALGQPGAPTGAAALPPPARPSGRTQRPGYRFPCRAGKSGARFHTACVAPGAGAGVGGDPASVISAWESELRTDVTEDAQGRNALAACD